MTTPDPILLPDGSELRFPAWRFWRVSLRWSRPARLPFVHGAVLRDFLAEIAGGRVSRSWLPPPLERLELGYNAARGGSFKADGGSSPESYGRPTDLPGVTGALSRVE